MTHTRRCLDSMECLSEPCSIQVASDQYRYAEIASKLTRIGHYPLDVCLLGGTGAGKSSKLNAFLNGEVAKVGYGPDPETIDIKSYSLSEQLRFWDVPGLGDGVNKDVHHSKKIIDLLSSRIQNDLGNRFIDMVLLIIDGSGKDLGTTLKLIREIVLPNIKDHKRLVVGLNQVDQAMKGEGFCHYHRVPRTPLRMYIEEKRRSVYRRLKESTGLDIPVVPYSAITGYNVTRLLDTIIDLMPQEKHKVV